MRAELLEPHNRENLPYGDTGLLQELLARFSADFLFFCAETSALKFSAGPGNALNFSPEVLALTWRAAENDKRTRPQNKKPEKIAETEAGNEKRTQKRNYRPELELSPIIGRALRWPCACASRTLAEGAGCAATAESPIYLADR